MHCGPVAQALCSLIRSPLLPAGFTFVDAPGSQICMRFAAPCNTPEVAVASGAGTVNFYTSEVGLACMTVRGWGVEHTVPSCWSLQKHPSRP